MAPESLFTPQPGDGHAFTHIARAASVYDFTQLAEIYNQARVDYIVPMPMNAKRMAEYIHNYDIDLDASVVSLNDHHQETGVGMLGIRDLRAWVTRLGVIPERRGNKAGLFIMESMLSHAAERGLTLAQLEVIVGNDPALKLFLKMGFEHTRELLIIRRPPAKPQPRPEWDALPFDAIPADDIPYYLEKREPGASWVEETTSLLNAGNLRGYTLELPGGEHGWIVFQRTPFQLTHFVLSPDASETMVAALLYRVHTEYPAQDTKIENVPLNHPTWTVFQSMGYLEVFRRYEMVLPLM